MADTEKEPKMDPPGGGQDTNTENDRNRIQYTDPEKTERIYSLFNFPRSHRNTQGKSEIKDRLLG